jgi:hypothetical protein
MLYYLNFFYIPIEFFLVNFTSTFLKYLELDNVNNNKAHHMNENVMTSIFVNGSLNKITPIINVIVGDIY